jgi:3'-phosphoadenosine 5'-phosphosulfate (PAPS) 3'-phosphatase
VDTLLDDYTHEAVQIARDAGQILRNRFGQPHDVRFKGTIDLVTEADRAAEDLIADRLRTLCPEHDLLCEEGSVGTTAGGVLDGGSSREAEAEKARPFIKCLTGGVVQRATKVTKATVPCHQDELRVAARDE